jgi:hypothetical protein
VINNCIVDSFTPPIIVMPLFFRTVQMRSLGQKRLGRWETFKPPTPISELL